MFLLLFGYMTPEFGLAPAIIVLAMLSICVNMAEGTTYGIVPFVIPAQMPVVSALVAAGGTLGAPIALNLFFRTMNNYMAFKMYSIYVLVSALSVFALFMDLGNAKCDEDNLAAIVPMPVHGLKVLPCEKEQLWQQGNVEDGKIQVSTWIKPMNLAVPPDPVAPTIDARDAHTPDEWVKRNPRMVRLTGDHPFNSEPPMHVLQEVGWVTPPSLFVVRNHGAAPKVFWETQRLEVTGVPSRCELSMDDSISGRTGTIVSTPVTFVCSENLLKQQSVTRTKTIGFNWGPAAVGNSVWAGIRLSDLL